uniref:Uncharacterized protein n=1 Tax=Rhipicephalus zambeziensis TaxID=60191 RepID=A0A224YWV5_9ACAR
MLTLHYDLIVVLSCQKIHICVNAHSVSVVLLQLVCKLQSMFITKKKTHSFHKFTYVIGNLAEQLLFVPFSVQCISNLWLIFSLYAFSRMTYNRVYFLKNKNICTTLGNNVPLHMGSAHFNVAGDSGQPQTNFM